MLKLRVLEILKEQGHTKYWLYKQMDMSYTNFDNLIKNRTHSIRFDTLEKLQQALGCSLDDLFERTPDEP
jgi:DNA-binding Xre family transcriptional regulator